MKAIFDRWMLFLTVFLSACGCAVCLFMLETTADNPFGRILWSGLFFSVPLLCGVAGSYLSELIHRRKFSVKRTGSRLVSAVLAAVLGFGIGAGGQALYMFSITENEERQAVDLVLLLDGSGSMQDKKEDCFQAAEDLIRGMEEENRAAAAAFAAVVLGSTDLTDMDETGKDELTEFIRGIDIVGGTDFEAPLNLAADLLLDRKTEGRRQAVILLSDGEGPVSEETEERYISEGIALYTVRIVSDNEIRPDEQRVIDLAQNTGGSDTEIRAGEDGSVRVEELLEAFRGAVRRTGGTEMSDRMLVYGETGKGFLWCAFIRILVCLLYAVLAGYVYYRKMNRTQLAGNLISGMILAGLIIVSGQLGLGSSVLSAVFFCVLIFAAYTTYDPEEGESGYVQ